MSMLRIAYRNPSSISVQGDGGDGSLSTATFGGFTRIQAISIRNNLLSNSMMSNLRVGSSSSSGCEVTGHCGHAPHDYTCQYSGCTLISQSRDSCTYYCTGCCT